MVDSEGEQDAPTRADAVAPAGDHAGRPPGPRPGIARLLWGPDRPATDEIAAGRARATVGVLAVLVVFLAAGALHAYATPPFAPPDETAHVAYALALAEGEIPRIDEFPEDLPIPGMPEGLSIWTANHPPGSYAILSLPLRIGIAQGDPLDGFWWARLTNVAAAGLALVLVGRIAATVLPHRPRVVVGATALAGLWPYSVQVAGTAYTDGIALAGTMSLTCAAVAVLCRGPSRWRLLGLVVLSAVAALMRAPSAVMVVLAGLAWGVANLVHGRNGLARRWLRGIGGGLLIGAAAAAAAGWFYLHNLDVYGDPTGSAALFELHLREPRGEFADILFRAHDYRFHVYQLWNRYEGLPPLPRSLMPPDTILAVYRAVGLALIGAVVAGTHRVVASIPALATRARVRPRALDGGRVAAWTLLITWWAALFAMMIQFVSGGGAPHARYLWPGAAGFGLVLAVGAEVIRMPRIEPPAGIRRWRDQAIPSVPIALPLAVAGLLWGNADTWLRYLELAGLRSGPDLPSAATAVLADAGFAAPGWLGLLACAAAVVGSAVVLWSIATTPSHVDVDEAPPLGASTWSGPLVERRRAPRPAVVGVGSEVG
ncbi:hypothetical protein [Euzebya sp.]|uniref:hypothetical protein n=1 Tax=Euzebya sp. TaxID=1971409 RepID=UPI00351196DB